MGYSRDEVVAAASVRPGLRTAEQQAAVASDPNNQAARNANEAAVKEQRIYGLKDHK